MVVLGVVWLISRGFYGQVIFQGMSDKVANFLNLSDYGARFLFGNLADPAYFFPDAGSWPGFLDEPGVAIFKICNAPTVAMRPGVAAMPGECFEREFRGNWNIAGETEQFTHFLKIPLQPDAVSTECRHE